MIAYVLALAVAILFAATPAFAQERDVLVAGGKKLFIEQGCYGCHTMEKIGTPIAPDLSHVGSTYPESYLARWLRDPASQKPNAHMPKLELNEEEIKALAAYLASLR